MARARFGLPPVPTASAAAGILDNTQFPTWAG